MFIIEQTTTPPPQKEQVPLDILKVNVNTGTPVTINQNAEIVPSAANNVQSPEPTQPSEPSGEPTRDPENVANVAKNAQSHPVRPKPAAKEPSRNQSCPCGSGTKYKRCCLNNLKTAPFVAKNVQAAAKASPPQEKKAA